MSLAIALSGGIDSAAAAWLLRREGHELTAVYMRHPYQPDENDLADARRVADFLRIPFHVIDVAEPFERVVAYFIEDYLHARTPNPCAVCNRAIKFGVLMDAALETGATGFATGHYARIPASSDTHDGRATPAVYRAIDSTKDQSYVLFGIERKRLADIRFPVGCFTKTEIRELVATANLPLPPKRESQDVCFIPDGKHAEFVRNRRPGIDTAGHFVSTEGKILAPHDGFERFTIGQRKGFGVGFGERIFVVRIDPETKNVTLGNRGDLVAREVVAERFNWLSDPIRDPRSPVRAEVKIRYRTPARPATIDICGEDRVHIRFDEPVEGVAPGQCAVLYDQERLLGGGFIAGTVREKESPDRA